MAGGGNRARCPCEPLCSLGSTIVAADTSYPIDSAHAHTLGYLLLPLSVRPAHREQTNKKIVELNLNENNLGSPGAIQIAEALKVNTSLTSVDLSLNYIDDKGGKAIAEALDVNKTLKVLNMSGNEIEDKDLRKKCRSRKL